MKRIAVVLIISFALCLGVQSALAHHSAAMFDNQKVKELTGTVKEFLSGRILTFGFRYTCKMPVA